MWASLTWLLMAFESSFSSADTFKLDLWQNFSDADFDVYMSCCISFARFEITVVPDANDDRQRTAVLPNGEIDLRGYMLFRS